MDIHDFEQWCARRDPKWYLQPIETIFDWIAEYAKEESLAEGVTLPHYVLQTEMKQARITAQKPQLSLF